MQLSRQFRVEVGVSTSDPLNHLASVLHVELADVESLLRQCASSAQTRRIGDVAGHLLDAGGKRIRPLLTLAAANILGGCPAAPRLAAAVEFIHTATLLHDDVVDRSSRRRGRPTANLLWDNKSSVLVGDFFFARAFQLMVETGSARALKILSDASAKIAEAEVMQLVSANNVGLKESEYIRIIEGKTAVLFAAAAEAGAVVADRDREAEDALSKYGHSLGICFQMIDDLLDYSGADASLGKDTGDDFRERKVTLPVIKAYAAGDEHARAFWRRAFSRIGDQEDSFSHALELLKQSGAFEQTWNAAARWRDSAMRSLDPLPKSPLRDLLASLADYALHRPS